MKQIQPVLCIGLLILYVFASAKIEPLIPSQSYNIWCNGHSWHHQILYLWNGRIDFIFAEANTYRMCPYLQSNTQLGRNWGEQEWCHSPKFLDCTHIFS